MVAETLRNIAYFAKRNATHAAGHESIAVVTGAGGQAAAGTAGSWYAALGGSTPAVMGVLGATAALSAGLAQMDYRHQRDELRELYREEIAALTGKPITKVKDRDLDIVARGHLTRGIPDNDILKDALKKLKKQRNLGVVLSIVASLASFAVIGAVAGTPMIEGLHGATEILAKSVVGVVAYNLVKMPLHWIGEKITGLHHETINDKVVSLLRQRSQDRAVTPEQVFAIFAQANPELQDLIKTRYGKRYERLDAVDQHEVADTVGKLMQVDKLADGINMGTINATEITFAAEGQASGVIHQHVFEPQQKTSIVQKVKGAWHNIVDRVTGRDHEQMDDYAPAIREGFVERLGREQAEADVSHVERLKQSRDDTPIPQR